MGREPPRGRPSAHLGRLVEEDESLAGRGRQLAPLALDVQILQDGADRDHQTCGRVETSVNNMGDTGGIGGATIQHRGTNPQRHLVHSGALVGDVVLSPHFHS